MGSEFQSCRCQRRSDIVVEVAADAAAFLGLRGHQFALGAAQVLTDADRLGGDGHGYRV